MAYQLRWRLRGHQRYLIPISELSQRESAGNTIQLCHKRSTARSALAPIASPFFFDLAEIPFDSVCLLAFGGGDEARCPHAEFSFSLKISYNRFMSNKPLKRILIIEDEKPIARALELKLTHAGFEAQSVSNGEEGLVLLEKGNFDLVLLDLVMPKLDGFSVLAEMKKKGIKTPVMVQTNLSQWEDEKRVKELGAKGFFIKSNTPIAEIVKQIKNFLN